MKYLPIILCVGIVVTFLVAGFAFRRASDVTVNVGRLRRQVWGIAAGSLGVYLLLWASLIYGPIWDSQANPSEDAVVEFDGGTRATGSLSRNWDRSWRLVTEDGTVRDFESYQTMEIRRPDIERPFASQWRSVAPAVISCIGLIALAIMGYAKVVFGKRA